MKKSYKISIIVFIITTLFLIVAFKPDDLNSELNVDETFIKTDYLDKGLPVMFDIGGHNCFSCKMMQDDLISLNSELEGRAVIKFVDVVAYKNLAAQFDFVVIPTQYFYDSSGKLYKMNEGVLSKTQILNIFKEMGYNFDR